MKSNIMSQAPLNIDESKALYMKTPKRYNARECYSNIYKAITANFEKASSGAWKVAYGYYNIGGFPNLLARHCFILDENNTVIDPTIYTHKPVTLDHQYYIMYVFPSIAEYLDAIDKADFRPGLNMAMRHYDAQAHEWALSHGYVLYG